MVAPSAMGRRRSFQFPVASSKFSLQFPHLQLNWPGVFDLTLNWKLGTGNLSFTTMPQDRPYRAGESIEDYCRACKIDRMHSIIVVDGEGRPVRVSCGFCRSEHNYRGGPRVATSGAPIVAKPAPRARAAATEPFPIVSDRERIA